MFEDVTLEVSDSTYPGRLNTTEEGYHVARFETWMSPNELEGKTDEDFRADLEAGVDFLRSRGCSTSPWSPRASAAGWPWSNYRRALIEWCCGCPQSWTKTPRTSSKRHRSTCHR